jgi:hypothetical protein
MVFTGNTESTYRMLVLLLDDQECLAGYDEQKIRARLG